MDTRRPNSGDRIRHIFLFALAMCLLVSMSSGAQTQSEAVVLAKDLHASSEAMVTCPLLAIPS